MRSRGFITLASPLTALFLTLVTGCAHAGPGADEPLVSHGAILSLAVFCLIGITVATLWLTWRYRRRKRLRAEKRASHNVALEIVWTIIPAIVVVIISVVGWSGLVSTTPLPHLNVEKAQVPAPLVEIGKSWFSKRGCGQCHSVDGSPSTGPTLKAAWGQERKFADGSIGVVDEDYIRESILEPQAKIRAGFSLMMPSFKGKLEDRQIDGIVAYVKSLR